MPGQAGILLEENKDPVVLQASSFSNGATGTAPAKLSWPQEKVTLLQGHWGWKMNAKGSSYRAPTTSAQSLRGQGL